MNSLNKVTLIGNLGQDPVVITTTSGSQFVTFSLATHEKWKTNVDSDEKATHSQETEWHQVVVFNEHILPFVEVHLKKGDQIYLEGKIKSRKRVTPEGQEVKVYEVVLSRFDGELKLLSKSKTSRDKAA